MIAHAHLKPVESATIQDLMSWIAGTRPTAKTLELLARCGATGTIWMLAHCDGGVTWGVAEGQTMKLAHGQLARWPVPLPTLTNTQQIRFFGATGEVLAWRDEDNYTLQQGRVIVDASEPTDSGDPLRPLDASYLLSGSELAREGGPSSAGFVALTQADGRVQVAPLPPPAGTPQRGYHLACLDLRHFLEADTETGCVRIAASRLVALRALKPNELVIEEPA